MNKHNLYTFFVGLFIPVLASTAVAQAPTYINDAKSICGVIEDTYSGFSVKQTQFGLSQDRFRTICRDFVDRETLFPSTSRSDFFRRVKNITSQFHDGHLTVRDKKSMKIWHTGLGFSLIDSRVIVIQNDDGPTKVETGDELVLIGGKNPAGFQPFPALDLNRPEYTKVAKIGSLAVFLSPDEPEQKSVDAHFRSWRTGRGYTEVLRFRQGRPPFLPKTLTNLSFLENKTAAVWQINSFTNNAKASIFQDLSKLRDHKEIKKLIIDLRKNGGGTTEVGNSLFSLFNHVKALQIDMNIQFLCSDLIKTRLSQVPYLTAVFSDGCPKGPEPKMSSTVAVDWKADYDREFNNFRDIDFSDVQIAIIISPFSYSTAEDFAMLMKLQKRAVLIGEPTGGGGTIPFVSLPLPESELMLSVPSLNWLYRENGSLVNLEGTGVSPNISCRPLHADIVEGRDRCLNIAIEMLIR